MQEMQVTQLAAAKPSGRNNYFASSLLANRTIMIRDRNRQSRSATRKTVVVSIKLSTVWERGTETRPCAASERRKKDLAILMDYGQPK